MKRLLLPPLLSLLAGQAWGATYYAAKVVGTIRYATGAWPTGLDTSAASLQALVNAVDAGGHTLVLDPGSAWTGADGVIDTAAGSITIRSPVSTDPDYATHHGSVIIGPPAAAGIVVRLDQSGVTLQGTTADPMIVVGHSGANTFGDILLTGTQNNVVLDGVTVEHHQPANYGIYVTALVGTGNEIKNCTVMNHSYVGGTDVQKFEAGETINSYGINVGSASTNLLLHGNTIGSIDYRWQYGVYINNTSPVQVYGNAISYSWDGQPYLVAAAAFGIDVVAGSSHLIYRNRVSYANKGISVAAGSGSIVSYNVVDSSAVNGIDVIGVNTGESTKVSNNTVMHRPFERAGHGMARQINGGNALFKNNIIDCYSTYNGTGFNIQAIEVAAAGGAVDINNNIYYLSGGAENTCRVGGLDTTYYATLAEWQAAIAGDARITPGKDTVSTAVANPLFAGASDYHLSPGSPAINAGADICATLGTATDYAGTPVCSGGVFVGRGSAPDIGAYEYLPKPAAALIAAGVFQ